MYLMSDPPNYEDIYFILFARTIVDDTMARINYFEWFESLSSSESRAHVPLVILSFYLKQVSNTQMLIELLRQKHATAPLQALIDLHWEGDNNVMCAWIKSIVPAVIASNSPASHQSNAA